MKLEVKVFSNIRLNVFRLIFGYKISHIEQLENGDETRIGQ